MTNLAPIVSKALSKMLCELVTKCKHWVAFQQLCSLCNAGGKPLRLAKAGLQLKNKEIVLYA